jgi:acetyltransferase
MLASATAEHFADCLEAVVADAGVDAVLIILPPPPAYPAEDVVDALLPIIEETPKPVVWALMGGARVDTAEQRLESVKVPVYRFPEPAIAGLAALVHRGRFLQKSQDHDSPPLDVDTEQVLETAKEYDAALMPDEAAAIVAAAGIPTAQTCRVQSGRSAIRTARRLGYPVVLKSAAPGVVHKTDLGGVALGIPGRTALTGAFRHMRQQSELAKRSNGDQIFFLQRMAPEGIDVVVGAIRDPQFGPIVMFGTGGIVTELRADVAFDLAPLSEHDALEMIDNTEAGLMLHGFRGKPALNTRPVADVICRMAALLQIVPELTELEINPLRVHEGGVVALDVRGTLVRPDAD